MFGDDPQKSYTFTKRGVVAMNAPPYRMILEDLLRGGIVPFLGAGASLAGRLQQTAWQAGQAGFPPSGRELARHLAESAEYPSDEPMDDLAKVASYFEVVGDRTKLRIKLTAVFDNNFETSALHELLARIPVPLLIVTTNYDTLIEKAFTACNKPFHVVQWTDNPKFAGSVLWWAPGDIEPKRYPPKLLPLEPGEETIVYKMHGGIVRSMPEWNSFVITEEDYIEFLARMVQQTAIPATFKSHLQSSSFLFLGYGLTDWNLRVLLHNVKKKVSAQKHPAVGNFEYLKSWAIQFNPSQLELKLWRGRHVDIYNVDLNDFVRELRIRMEQSAR